MPRLLVAALVIVGAALLSLPPLLAGAAGGNSLDNAADLAAIQTGTLDPGADTWYRMWSDGSNKPVGAVFQFVPANNNPNITFHVWVKERQGTSNLYKNIDIGQATDNFGKLPAGVRYWRGSADQKRFYYLQVVNWAADSSIDYSIVATGEAFPPPTPGVTSTAATAPMDPPVPTSYPDAIYSFSSMRKVAGYTIRLWEANSPFRAWPATKIVTISPPDQPTAIAEQIEMVASIDDLTGKDITGEGLPELVIKTHTGGEACCFSTRVYQLGPELKKLLQTAFNSCAGSLRDVDEDGRYEYVTCDESFIDRYCPPADSPTVRAVLKYDQTAGYYPAGHLYPLAFWEDTDLAGRLALAAAPGKRNERDGTSKCSVLPLVINLLYSGQTGEAWAALEKYYKEPDRADFQADIESVARSSPFFPKP